MPRISTVATMAAVAALREGEILALRFPAMSADAKRAAHAIFAAERPAPVQAGAPVGKLTERELNETLEELRERLERESPTKKKAKKGRGGSGWQRGPSGDTEDRAAASLAQMAANIQEASRR